MAVRLGLSFHVRGMLLVLVLAAGAPALGQLRIVNYNVAQLNGNVAALEDVFAALNEDDKPGFAVAPHVYVFQEVQSADTSPLLTMLNNQAPPGVSYVLGTYTNSGEDGYGGAQAMCYRSDKLIELVGGHSDIYTGAGRYSDRWRFRVLDYLGADAKFYIYSSHLKAGTAGSDEADRLSGAQAIRNDADALPADTHIIYAGDWNTYSNSEPAYLEFISAGNGQAIDPLGTGSWSGSGKAIKHTQSPRLTGGGLTGGGMDDRFDFQLSTSAFHDDEGYSYIAGSYRTLANDGNHYNQAINYGNNSYYPGDLPRSNALADDVRDASDHCPVVVDYQLPAWMDANMPSDFGRVIQGAPVNVDMQVSNVAVVVAAVGADELDYSAMASGVLSGSCSGSVLALDPPDTCQFAVDTGTVGAAAGSVDLTSTSEAVANAPLALPISGHVVRASAASFDPNTDLTGTTVSKSAGPDSGIVTFDIEVYNRGYDADQALLDIDGVNNVAAPFSFVGGLASGIGATPATLSFDFDTSGLSVGPYSNVITIDVSDEDIPGESASALMLTLEVDIQELPGDVDGNCIVDLTDLGLLLIAFGTCTGEPGFLASADFDVSGCIDLTDLGIQLLNFGTSCP